MYTIISNPDGDPIIHNLHLRVRWFRARRFGGPDRAEVEFPPTSAGQAGQPWEILTWLGYGLTILDDNLQPVWWGVIEEAIVPHGNSRAGLTLDSMANRIAVAYMDNNRERHTTQWAQDDASIARYGVRERLLSLSDATEGQAEAKRDNALGELARPQKIREVGGGSAMIVAEGRYNRLNDLYYTDSRGKKISATKRPTKQLVGYGFSSWGICFGKGYLFDFNYNLSPLFDGVKVNITGTRYGVNNKTFTISGDPEGTEGFSYTSDEIRYDQPDDIFDDKLGADGTAANNGAFSWVLEPAFIHIDNPNSGHSENVGNFLVERKKADNYLEISPSVSGNLQTDDPTDTVTFSQAQRLKVKEKMEAQRPELLVNAVVGTGVGEKVAIPITVDETWPLGEVWLPVGVTGDVGDNLNVDLHYSNIDESAPGTVARTAHVLGSELPTNPTLYRFRYSPLNLTAGVKFWIVISRSGGVSSSGAYVMELEDDPGGQVLLHDGTSWQSGSYRIAYELWGVQETTQTIADIAQASGLFAGVDVRVASNLYGRMYRDGDATCLDEMEDLLEMGTSAGDQLIARVDQRGYLVVEKQPGRDAIENLVDRNGQLLNSSGRKLTEGFLPVGQWVEIPDIPGDINAAIGLSPYLVEAAEWAEGSGLTIDPLITLRGIDEF